MKVFLHYEDNENVDFHKSLKITLPKSWKTGPASNLLSQFIKSYNAKYQDSNPLDEASMHLSQRVAKIDDTDGKSELVDICSDAVVLDEMADRADIYICHGPSQTKEQVVAKRQAEEQARKDALKSTVSCTHFGCQKRFPKGGPYPNDCKFHKLPPVFHETAKYWACCPNKKAYDWEDFQNIPGCETGTCTEIKEEGKMFLGGTDLREQANDGANLKSIDDFNKAQSGGGEAAPVLERLQRVMAEVGVEKELFDQVVEGMKKEYATTASNDAELLQAISKDLGDRMKGMMKAVAAEQLRIK